MKNYDSSSFFKGYISNSSFSRSFRNRSTEPMPSECGCLPVSDGFRAKQPKYVAMPMQNHSMCGKVQSSFQQCGNGTSSGLPDKYRS